MKNEVTFEGMVYTEPEFSHKRGKKVFYKFLVACKRKSNVYDNIPVVVTEEMKKFFPIIIGDYIRVKGRFQSYNSKSPENYGKRILYINAFEVEFCGNNDNKNRITLDGIVCKPIIYRTTPKGKQISDVILKTYSDKGVYYIPCIFWFENALKANLYDVGAHIVVKGRLQSREFIKFDDNQKSYHMAYELSVNDFKEIEKENK